MDHHIWGLSMVKNLAGQVFPESEWISFDHLGLGSRGNPKKWVPGVPQQLDGFFRRKSIYKWMTFRLPPAIHLQTWWVNSFWIGECSALKFIVGFGTFFHGISAAFSLQGSTSRETIRCVWFFWYGRSLSLLAKNKPKKTREEEKKLTFPHVSTACFLAVSLSSQK